MALGVIFLNIKFRDPKVSIVMPTFNMQKHISEAIDSILSQSFDDWELIIVDDCSTDSTPAIVQQYVEIDRRIRSTRTRKNTNLPGAARNVGIALATGRYIAFLDHDDIWRSIKLERQLEAFSLDASVELVHSHLLGLNESPLLKFTTLSNPFRRKANKATLSERNVIQCSSVLVKSSAIKAHLGFSEDPNLRAVEDYDLWFRIIDGGRSSFVSEIHGHYRFAASGTLAQTHLAERLVSFDRKNGTQTARYGRSKTRRIFAGIFAFPMAFYFYYIEGEFRILTRRKPRIWA
jgi:teichuronic acid biosynthesis glycosyltransferase TuaG